MQGMSIDFSSFLPFAFCLLTVIASNDGKWASAFLSFWFIPFSSSSQILLV